MTNGKVQITIKSTQTDISDESMESTYTGNYRQLAGKHIVTYEEYFESEGTFPAKNTNLMKIEKNSIQITKKGAITTQMYFASDKKHSGSYQTPFGNFDMTIHTEYLTVQETNQTVTADIVYHLSLNGSPVSKCNIHMKIKNETGTIL